MDRVGASERVYLGLVGVVGVVVNAAVCDDVLEGLVHDAPRAAVVPLLFGTVHQVLRTEGHHPPRGLLQLPLQRSHRAEGPAGTAVPLRDRRLDPAASLC